MQAGRRYSSRTQALTVRLPDPLPLYPQRVGSCQSPLLGASKTLPTKKTGKMLLAADEDYGLLERLFST